MTELLCAYPRQPTLRYLKVFQTMYGVGSVVGVGVGERRRKPRAQNSHLVRTCVLGKLLEKAPSRIAGVGLVKISRRAK